MGTENGTNERRTHGVSGMEFGREVFQLSLWKQGTMADGNSGSQVPLPLEEEVDFDLFG